MREKRGIVNAADARGGNCSPPILLLEGGKKQQPQGLLGQTVHKGHRA